MGGECDANANGNFNGSPRQFLAADAVVPMRRFSAILSILRTDSPACLGFLESDRLRHFLLEFSS